MSEEQVCRYCSHSEGRLPLSKERRKFIIVATFDAVLITSLWILCTIKKGGEDWRSEFLEEINLFDCDFLERSLFDLAILANLRVVVLLLFYVAIRCQQWLPVASCTVCSTLYTVAKIFLFFGQKRTPNAVNFDRHGSSRHDGVPQYFIVVASLFVAWFELWLMPFRVLSAERSLDGFAYHRHHSSPSAEIGERRAVTRSAQSRHVRSAVARTSLTHSSETYQSNNTYRKQIVSEDEFHSALEYSSSDDEIPQHKAASASNAGIGQILRNKSLQLAAEARTKANAMLSESPTWRIIHAKTPLIRVDDTTNTYYVSAEFSHAPRNIFDAIWWKSQSWNRNVNSFRVLNKIDARTDVVMVTSMPSLGGYVSQRDFVDVRTYDYDSDKNSFFGVYTSVETTGRANSEQAIWGKNGVNAMRVTPIPSETKGVQPLTKFEWLMNTDLQGSIPRVLIRRTMSSFLCDYVSSLDKFLRRGSDVSTSAER